MEDTKYMARAWCPGCEPGCDPTLEVLEVRWCETHCPERGGSQDELATGVSAYLSGSAEAGGEDNRKICDLIHRPYATES